MPGLVAPEIESYVESHTSPPSAALATVIEETRAMGEISGMMTGPVETEFVGVVDPVTLRWAVTEKGAA